MILETRRTEMNFKNFFSKIFLLAAVVFFAAPVFILAEGDTADPAASSGDVINVVDTGKNFCQRFESASSKIDQKIASLESKLAEKRAQTSNKIGQMQSERDQKLSEKRSSWDVKRNNIYTKLEAKAGNNEQKQAVIAFKVEIEQAVTVRRAAVDKAITDFRDGLKQSLERRKSKADGILLNYKNEIGSAFEKARSSCQGGTAPKTVRENLLSDLRTAKENFSLAKQGAITAGLEAGNLQGIKTAVINTALDNFRSAFEAAKNKLKGAFPGQDI